ncbi:hypothetical protein CIL03_07720 [Virgibacillus indicus]|uniref:Uncharacterized protein n=1 Tax=Virgibacillus indicus TaxID=2024554 RepID=A0A265NA45_9BACI|nr:hypothetical protein CIL03_07720 [Virgibacillus indicus]
MILKSTCSFKHSVNRLIYPLQIGGEIVDYYYNPEVRFLLINQSEETYKVNYVQNSFPAPVIGPRPPYYIYPVYEQYYPVI